MLAGSTVYGDGIYEDNMGRTYCVDEGLIGVIPIEAIKNHKGLDNIVDFQEDFVAEIEDGIFTFGDIIIDTADDETYDEEE